jgi:hypothetical protein
MATKTSLSAVMAILSMLPLPLSSAAQEALMSPSGATARLPAAPAGPPLVENAPLVDPDPGTIFFLPAARTLPKGKVGVGLLRSFGFGVSVGITDCLTVGVGASPTVSLQLDVKWSIIKGLRHTLSLWGFFHYPFLLMIYRGGERDDSEDSGFMVSGGLLYAFQGEKFETKLGLLYHDFVMVDRFDICRGEDCVGNTNFYHKWIMVSPYIEVGYRVARHVNLMGLVTSFEISSTAAEKEVVGDDVSVRERRSFFWQDVIIILGLRYFRKRFALDAGVAIPVVPRYWGGEDYPYAFPVAGLSWIL